MEPVRRRFWTGKRITGAIVVPLFGIALIRAVVMLSQSRGAYGAGVACGTSLILIIFICGVVYLIRG